MALEGITQRGIEAILAEALLEVLTEWCITNVPTSDPSRANHVVLGKPTRELRDANVVSIHMQHPLGPSADKDERVSGTPRGQDERGHYFPAETLGGMIVEKIIGAVQVNVRQKLAYTNAIEINASIVQRVKAAVNRDKQLVPLKDDFGTTLFKLETFQAAGHASGGGNVSINIRWIDWRAFSSVTNCRG
jgi:hypothetical protein